MTEVRNLLAHASLHDEVAAVLEQRSRCLISLRLRQHIGQDLRPFLVADRFDNPLGDAEADRLCAVSPPSSRTQPSSVSGSPSALALVTIPMIRSVRLDPVLSLFDDEAEPLSSFARLLGTGPTCRPLPRCVLQGRLKMPVRSVCSSRPDVASTRCRRFQRQSEVCFGQALRANATPK